LVHSLHRLRGPWFDSQLWQKNCLPLHRCRFRISTLNEGGPPIELPSLWDTLVQVESPLMLRPGKHWIKHSVDQFLEIPDLAKIRKKITFARVSLQSAGTYIGSEPNSICGVGTKTKNWSSLSPYLLSYNGCDYLRSPTDFGIATSSPWSVSLLVLESSLSFIPAEAGGQPFFCVAAIIYTFCKKKIN